MAYISQEKKKEIGEHLKKIIPEWKFSLRVGDGNRTLKMSILSADIDLPQIFYKATRGELDHQFVKFESGQFQINWVNFSLLKNKDLENKFLEIKAALNDGNYDNSDPYTDYFSVGWYVDLQVGSSNKPFYVVNKLKKIAEKVMKQKIEKPKRVTL